MTDVTHNPISAIQLAGCLKLPNPSAESRELVRAVAAAYYGSYYYLDAPLYLQSADLKQQLIKEPLLQDTLKGTENMSAVITGIGSKSSLPIIKTYIQSIYLGS
jgi:DNA-binding transcriptional regulator LsrR (DeoR family)